jgi:hypothetical protein
MKSLGTDSLILGMVNNQIYFDYNLIEKKKLNLATIKAATMAWLNKRPEIEFLMDMENPDGTSIPDPITKMAVNGYCKSRSGSILVVFNPAWYDNGGKYTGMTHGAWNPYDTHIPLIWYGWNIERGTSYRTISMTDISATLAAMLHIQMPNGCIGNVIEEAIRH